MKFEFEIPDEALNDIVRAQVNHIQGINGFWSIADAIKAKIIETTSNYVYTEAIEKIIDAKLEKMTEDILDKKLAGHIKHIVKRSAKEHFSIEELNHQAELSRQTQENI